MTVRFTLRSSGSVDQYTESVKADIERVVAGKAGVPARYVHADVVSGSVLLQLSIETSSNQHAAAVVSTMQIAIANASAATLLLSSVASLSISVESIIDLPVAEAGSVTSPPHLPNGGNHGVLIPALASVGTGAFVVVLAASMWAWMRHRKVSQAMYKANGTTIGQRPVVTQAESSAMISAPVVHAASLQESLQA